MSYNVICSADFGAANSGLTLNGKLFDIAGVQVGATVTSGFVEASAGLYLYVLSAPDDHAGVFVVYKSTDSSLRRTVVIAPRETEYNDAKTSTRLAGASYTAPDNTTIAAIAALVAALPSAATIASAVWGSGSRTLTSFGTLIADIWSYATRTLSSGGFSAAGVWDYLTSSISTTGSIGKLLTDRIDASISSVAVIAAAANPDSVDGATITMRQAVTFDGTLSGLGAIIPVSWTKAIFTVKSATWLPDSQAIIQIQVSNPGSGGDGLIMLNGASSTLANASLSVNQGAGTVTIHIEDDALAAVAADSYTYDVKFYYGTSDSVATTPATCTVNDVVTQTV